MKIVIVGGGAAGMLAAISASKVNNSLIEKGKEPSQIILLEKNEKLGKKLFISGKGRCNVTNDCDSEEFFNNIVNNKKFFYSAFSEFSNKDLEALIESGGCKLKVERGNRVFPISDKSYDVIDSLKKTISKLGAKVYLNTEVERIELVTGIDNKFNIICSNQKNIVADRVIIATGGLSYPTTGSTGDGYRFAKNFNINVIAQKPSLVPFNILEVSECKELQGLTLKNVAIKIYDISNKAKVLYKDFGEMLFTHFGVSGPIILSASCFVDGKNILSIDFKPALDAEKLDARLLREFDSNKNKKLKTIMETLLPKSMVEAFMTRLAKSFNNINDVKVSEVDKSIRKSIVELLKNYEFTIVGKRDFDEAIITRGGIDVKEINPKTMESKKVKGLYFAGEVIDIDAMTGGFNIQIAASIGYVAGMNVGDNI